VLCKVKDFVLQSSLKNRGAAVQVSVKTFAQAVGKARKELTYSAEKRCELCNWCWRWHLAEEVTDRKVTDSRRPSK